MTSLRRLLHHGLPAALLALAGAALAQTTPAAAPAPAPAPVAQQALVSGPAGSVSQRQLDAAVEFLLAPAQRAEFYANPRSIENMALALYARQALEAQARQHGFADRPEVQQVVGVAAQQALTDYWMLHQIEQRLPSEQQIEQYARSVHDAQPERARQQAGQPIVQLRLRHIMLAISPELGDAQAKAKADSLLAELKAGADFQALARRDSTDPGSAARGGAMAEPLVAEAGRSPFDDAALKLRQPGEISEVVKSKDGYHIIQLIERKSLSGFERQREQLMAQARARLQSQARAEIWNAAQAGANVDPGVVKSLVRPLEAK